MARESEGGGYGLIVGVSVLAALAGGVFVLNRPLETQRPTERVSVQTTVASDETVPARLWQDPLEAIQRDWNRIVTYAAERESLPPLVRLPKTISQVAADMQKAIAELRILVMLPGAPFAEDAEQRRRQRYAIVSALTERDFVPVDSEHVGYFLAPSFDWKPDGGALEDSVCEGDEGTRLRCPLADPPILIGFERYERSQEQRIERSGGTAAASASAPAPAWRTVRVFWLNADDFAIDPYRRVTSLMVALDGERSRQSRGTNRFGAGAAETVLLGPGTSDAMLNFVNAILRVEDDRQRALLSAAAGFVEASRSYPGDAGRILLSSWERPNLEEYEVSLNMELDLVEDAIESIDGYLDFGLPPDAAESLRNCLKSESGKGANATPLAACLALLPKIADSDPNWQQWVQSNLPADPAGTQAAIVGASGDEVNLRRLLVMVDDYLDSGLPAIESPDKLRACLTTLDSSASECLRSSIAVSDSDPNWAETVTAMWVESDFEGTLRRKGSEIAFLSVRATAPLQWLLLPKVAEKLKDNGASESDVLTTYDISPEAVERLEDAIRKAQGVAEFRSVIARDDLVVSEILKELERRGVCKGGTRPVIAIVSEQDTTYGRLLDDVVRQVAGDKGLEDCSFHVEGFRYLRGVDGELPPGSPASSGGEDEEVAAGADRGWLAALLPRGRLESAAGNSQLDYVRRLADTMEEFDYSARTIGLPPSGEEPCESGPESPACVSGSMAAIGILGSDVYDKQLILQALRERFPSATFFTTDLDARWTNPESYSWSRNLIIGSGYGLSVPGQRITAFRDSYQTSLFRAVNLALGPEGHTGGAIPGRDQTRFAPAPRLFEIARSGALDITPCSELCSRLNRIHGGMRDPAKNIPGRLLSAALLLFPLLLFTGVTYYLDSRLVARDRSNPLHRAHWLVLKLCTGLTLVLGSALVLWHEVPRLWGWQGLENYFHLEPWLLFEGVSSVPTLVLNVTTSALALGILAIMIARIQSKQRAIETRFGLVGANDWTWLRSPASIIRDATVFVWLREVDRDKETPISIGALWSRYRPMSSWQARLLRIAFRTVLTAIGVFIWVSTYEPAPHLSSNLSGVLDVARSTTLVLVLGAMYFCTDALKLASAKVYALSILRLKGWPDTPDDEVLPAPIRDRSLAMDLIVDCTQIATRVVYLPCILVFLLMLARSTVFEGWVWTPGILALYAVFTAYVLVRALQFQFTAVRARDRILEEMNLHLHKAGDDEGQAKRIEKVMTRIRGIREGAFLPWTRNPILQSVALPSGGVGLLSLLNNLLA